MFREEKGTKDQRKSRGTAASWRPQRERELPEESGHWREVREPRAQEQAPGPSRCSGWESVKGRKQRQLVEVGAKSLTAKGKWIRGMGHCKILLLEVIQWFSTFVNQHQKRACKNPADQALPQSL